MTRFARLLIVGLLCLSGVAMGGEADGPYMLIYRANRAPTWSSNAVYTPISANGAICAGSLCSFQERDILIEYFPTVEKALERLNHRPQFFDSDTIINGVPCFGCSGPHGAPEPDIKPDDLIGLFKARRIDLSLGPNGRKTTVTHQVTKTEEVPVQEWDVKPAGKPPVWEWNMNTPSALIRTIREQ